MITTLSPQTHALITEINAAYREGWVDLEARDSLIVFYLANQSRYPQAPPLADLLEDYEATRKDENRRHLLKHGMWSDADE